MPSRALRCVGDIGLRQLQRAFANGQGANQGTHQRGFADAVAPDKAQHFGAVQFQRDPIQDASAAITARYSAGLQ